MGWYKEACNFCCQLCLTFNVRDNEHLRLGKSLLEVVEVDGAVKGDEAYLCPRVSRKPRTQTQKLALRQKEWPTSNVFTKLSLSKHLKFVYQLSLKLFKHNKKWQIRPHSCFEHL